MVFGIESSGRVQHHRTHYDRPRTRTAIGGQVHGKRVVSVQQRAHRRLGFPPAEGLRGTSQQHHVAAHSRQIPRLVGLEPIARILGSTLRQRTSWLSLSGVSEIRKMAANLPETWAAKKATNILASLSDICILHSHSLVEADWQGDHSRVDPTCFYWGKWKDTRLSVTDVILAFGE